LCFADKRSSQNTENIEQDTVEMAIIFSNNDKPKVTYGAIDMYLNGIFRVAPKGLGIQMLLNPFEKQLNTPALLIQHYKIFCADIKQICHVCKRVFEFHGVIHDFAKFSRIFFFGLIAGKFNDLFTDNTVIIFGKLKTHKLFIMHNDSN